MSDFFKEGMQKYREGDYEQAGELFQQDLENDDQNPKAWNALGICFSKLKEYEDASTCFDNALMLDPGNATYEKNLTNNQSHIEKKSLTTTPKVISNPTSQKETLSSEIKKLKDNFDTSSLETSPVVSMFKNDPWYVIILIILSVSGGYALKALLNSDYSGFLGIGGFTFLVYCVAVVLGALYYLNELDKSALVRLDSRPVTSFDQILAILKAIVFPFFYILIAGIFITKFL